VSVVALVGNGLSIAYNPELSVPSLTLELLRRFDDADDELRAIAAEARESDTPGFEQLLGPFDAVSAMIRNLPGIRSGGGWVPKFDDLGVALEAAREIHSRGTGLALSVIAERSQIQGDFLPIDAFCSAIADLDNPSDLTIATLNYDGLLAAGFLQEGIYPDWTVRRTLYTSDMGDGRTEEELVPDFAEGRSLRTWELRRIPDFMPERARLLNLHGSLGWLRHTDDPEDVRRFRIPDLRDTGFWTKHSRGETAWEPVVVLTSRKTELTEEWPFLLCYSELRRALIEADRWLIAGYGFADDPVDRAFKSAVRARQRRNQESRVLAIGLGRPRVIRARMRAKLGIPTDWITASGDGLPAAIDDDQWQEWAS
jgi:hypothetical protein